MRMFCGYCLFESGPDRMHVSRDELHGFRLTGQMLMWLLLISSWGIWGTTEWFIPHIFLPSYPFSFISYHPLLSLAYFCIEISKKKKCKKEANIIFGTFKHWISLHRNTLSFSAYKLDTVSTSLHPPLLLPLTLSVWLFLCLSFSSFPEAGEAAVNYSPTAPRHRRQPSSFTHAGTDRQGGQTSVDLLEKRGEAEGILSHPWTRIEIIDRSCLGSAHVLLCTVYLYPPFSSSALGMRWAEGWNLRFIKAKNLKRRSYHTERLKCCINTANILPW